ncbi:RNA-directed DNA polymerase, eukaryota, reverse transcriptase zinc-binding domain protein [Tanacetum coccineum]
MSSNRPIEKRQVRVPSVGKKDCWEELKNYNTVDVEEGECVVHNRGEMMNEQVEEVIMDPRVNTSKDSNEDVIDCESKKESVQNEEHKSSYASKAKCMTYDNKLSHIPTSTNEDGSVFMIFDKEIVQEGSKKWEFTVCGFYVGYKMLVQELRFNLCRMWGRYRLRNIIPNRNEVFLFKFWNKTGVESVIENGLWMVNGKPIALASRLGTPLIIDKVTIDMCNGGMGKVSFARVLIEVVADKGLPNNIDIVYKDGKCTVIGKKYVKVQYDWAPPLCTFCCMFGHYDKDCGRRPKTVEELEEIKKTNTNNAVEKEEFVQVRNRKRGGKTVMNKGNKEVRKEGHAKNNVVYRPIEKTTNKKNDVESSKASNKESAKVHGSPGKQSNTGWVVQQDIIDSIRKSANKFSVLQDDEDGMINNENEMHDEESDVYEEGEGSASMMSQNEMNYSYAAMLNGSVDRGKGDTN